MKKNFLALLMLVFAPAFLFAQKGTGLNFSPKKFESTDVIDKPFGFGENLPSASNLKAYVPYIGDQGQYGTCVGWSSTYYMATMEYAIQMGITDRKEISANAFDPYYTYLNITTKDDYFDCASGSYLYDACYHLYEDGGKRFGYNELECGAYISTRNEEKNNMIDFTNFFRLIEQDATMDENGTNIKQAIVDKHPVLIGMSLPDSFFEIGSDGIFRPKPEEKDYLRSYGGHAMALVGYDDAINGGSFIIVNSWGPSWGDNGYCYVNYDDFFDYTFEAYSMASALKDDVKNGEGCVYGDCQNGYGRYVYSNGNTYEGDWVEGKREGYGLYIWDDNAFFGGEFDGLRHGKGMYKEDASGELRGYWKNDAYNGNDIVINEANSDEKFDNILDDQLALSDINDLNQLLDDRDFLISLRDVPNSHCVWGDCENGLGVYVNAEENWIYFGTFADDIRNGMGTFKWFAEGDLGHAYHGTFISGYRAGIGTYYFPNGNRYYGEWSSGNRHGQGAFFFADGSNMCGNWENGDFTSDSMGFGEADLGTTIEEKVETQEGSGDRKITEEEKVEDKKKSKKKKANK